VSFLLDLENHKEITLEKVIINFDEHVILKTIAKKKDQLKENTKNE